MPTWYRAGGHRSVRSHDAGTQSEGFKRGDTEFSQQALLKYAKDPLQRVCGKQSGSALATVDNWRRPILLRYSKKNADVRLPSCESLA
jgi:hypothetical protein